MKFKVDVEIDWLHEEDGLDERLQREIVEEIKNSIQKHTLNKMESLIYNQVKNNIDTWINERLHEFTDRVIRVTDKWGDTVESHKSLNDMFKERFDGFLTKAVDKDGKQIDGCAYGNSKNRIEYLLEKKASEVMSQITKKIDSSVSYITTKAMQKEMEDNIRKHVIEQTRKIILPE